jgi:hypothetical protein
MNVRTKLAVLLVMAAGFAAMPDARACTCHRPDVAQAKNRADVVFAGTVEDVTVVDEPKSWEPRIIVRFKVDRVWKGPVEREFTMHSHFESSSCAGFFRALAKPGESLLVYGYGVPAKAWKRNGLAGSDNAGSYTTLRRSDKPPVRADLIDAVEDDATVYTTDICTRTVFERDAREDLQELGAAREPGPPANGKIPAN